MGNNVSKELQQLQEENRQLKLQLIHVRGAETSLKRKVEVLEYLDTCKQKKLKYMQDQVSELKSDKCERRIFLQKKVDELEELVGSSTNQLKQVQEVNIKLAKQVSELEADKMMRGEQELGKMMLMQEKLVLQKKVEELERLVDSSRNKARKLDSVENFLACGICLKTKPLSVEWSYCGHLVCYECMFGVISKLPGLFHLAMRDNDGKLQCQINEKLLFCPSCDRYPVHWDEFLQAPLRRFNTVLAIPSSSTLRILQSIRKDQEQEQEFKCLFCPTRYASSLDALQHCHVCPARYVSCPFCREEWVIGLVHDRYGDVSINMNDLMSHLLTRCRVYCLYPLDSRNAVVAVRESAFHFRQHAAVNASV